MYSRKDPHFETRSDLEEKPNLFKSGFMTSNPSLISDNTLERPEPRRKKDSLKTDLAFILGENLVSNSEGSFFFVALKFKKT